MPSATSRAPSKVSDCGLCDTLKDEPMVEFDSSIMYKHFVKGLDIYTFNFASHSSDCLSDTVKAKKFVAQSVYKTGENERNQKMVIDGTEGLFFKGRVRLFVPPSLEAAVERLGVRQGDKLRAFYCPNTSQILLLESYRLIRAYTVEKAFRIKDIDA